MNTPAPSHLARRALLPEVMTMRDLGLAIDLTPNGARRAVVEGRLPVPFYRFGRRILVRREALLAALVEAEEMAEEVPEEPAPDSRPPPTWAPELRRRLGEGAP